MGRPRNDGGPTAPQRLEAAFFDLLSATPYQDVTISALVREAGVNRNSFYYHYTDLDDLARGATDNVVLSEIAHLIASGLTPASEQVDQLSRVPGMAERVRRMLILTGSHSTARLRGIVREAVQDIWLAEFGLEREDLEPQEEAALDFIAGGAMALLSRVDPSITGKEGPPELTLELIAEIRSIPVLTVGARFLADTLQEARARKRDE